jgi:hypothetical protein
MRRAAGTAVGNEPGVDVVNIHAQFNQMNAPDQRLLCRECLVCPGKGI